MCWVAAVLHQSLDVLEARDVEELLELSEHAKQLAGQLAALRGI